MKEDTLSGENNMPKHGESEPVITGENIDGSIDTVNELKKEIEKLKKQKNPLESKGKLKQKKGIDQQVRVKKDSEKIKKKKKPKLNVFQRLKRMLNKEKKQNKGKGSEQGVVKVSKSAKNTVVDSFLKPSKGNKKEKTAPKKKRTDTHVKIDYKAFAELNKHIKKLQRETAEGKSRRGVRGNKTQVKVTSRPSI